MATLQRQKPQKQVVGKWEESFPVQQVTEIQSTVFVKKLLAVAVSNIAYLRVIFPERAFGDRNLEDLKLKILKSDKCCPGAARMVDWLKGVFDALDKKYLRALIFGIYKSKDDPNTFVEAYTFKFSYESGTNMELFSNDKKLSSSNSSDHTRKATLSLLRTLVILMQTLKPLPEDYQVTMKLLYYDDVTPKDYEPPGFKAAETDAVFFDDNPLKIRIGSVATAFHSFKLRLTTDREQFKPTDEDEERIATDLQAVDISAMQGLDLGLDDSHSMNASTYNMETSADRANLASIENPNNLATPSEHEHPDNITDDQHDEAAVEESNEELGVRCPCASNEDDGLMLQCGNCNYWQHAVCFKVLDASEAPRNHTCNFCCESGCSRLPTDASLLKLSRCDAQMLCLYRRTLFACLEVDELTTTQLSHRLGVKRNIAQSLMDRLKNEGYFKTGAAARGKNSKASKILDKAKVSTDAIKNYFNIDPVNVAQHLVSQTSSIDFQYQRPTGHGSKRRLITEHISLPVIGEVRLATESEYAAANKSYTFELSNTQEEFETQQPRRKRAKASIAENRED